MGATQFRLLCSLGLRANHTLLDVGCGSLRAGRLFLVYLDEGRYCGIEPNEWLINDAVTNQLGKDLIGIKKPRFDHNAEFRTAVFSQQFDFIVAQSIFSHTGADLIGVALRNFSESLKPDGLIVVTFVEGQRDFDGTGWVYPASVSFRRASIRRFAESAALHVTRIPWYHPRQSWYVLAKDRNRLPTHNMMSHLSGSVLFAPEFAESCALRPRMIRAARNYARRHLPDALRVKFGLGA
jgi:SAM-dependent methyltransferase